MEYRLPLTFNELWTRSTLSKCYQQCSFRFDVDHANDTKVLRKIHRVKKKLRK